MRRRLPMEYDSVMGSSWFTRVAPRYSLRTLVVLLLVATGLWGVWSRRRARIKSHVLAGHSAEVTGADVASDGSMVATVSLDDTIRIWSLGTGRCIRVVRMQDRPAGLPSVTISPKGEYLLTDHAIPGGITVWDLITGKAVMKLAARAGWGYKFSVSGRYIWTWGSADREREMVLQVRDPKTGEHVGEVPFKQGDEPVFEGERLWAAEYYAAVESESLQLRRLMGEDPSIVRGQLGLTKLLPDGRWQVTRGGGFSAVVWRVRLARELASPHLWPETWLTVVAAALLVLSIIKDRRTFRRKAAGAQSEVIGEAESQP